MYKTRPATLERDLFLCLMHKKIVNFALIGKSFLPIKSVSNDCQIANFKSASLIIHVKDTIHICVYRTNEKKNEEARQTKNKVQYLKLNIPRIQLGMAKTII